MSQSQRSIYNATCKAYIVRDISMQKSSSLIVQGENSSILRIQGVCLPKGEGIGGLTVSAFYTLINRLTMFLFMEQHWTLALY